VIEFRLLGPLEALEDGRSLPLGGRQQRAVLAILLLHANELVSTEQLIDVLWGERPPPTAAATVQVYVSRLRKLLGHELLVTREPGYVLRVDPDTVDAKRAERLVARARSAGDPGERAGLLREALGLWRGMPLGDLAYERFGQIEAGRLEEERLGVVEDRIEAEIALGRSTELVTELERLVADNPLRERPREQLMRVLYLSGRQADALAAYRLARGVFVDELGLEPSPALQELERQILNHDPALGQAVRSGVSTRVAQIEPERREERKLVTVLFADLAGFMGRAEQLDPEDVRTLLRRFQRPVRVELERFGGTIEKFVGEAVMAVFGAPAAHEDDAERAVRAGFAVLEALAVLRADDSFQDLDVRIGIDTGRALVALGKNASSEGMVAGDVVTTAARLQAAAPANSILVGDATRRASEHAIEYRRVRPVKARRNAASLRASQAVRERVPIGSRRAPPHSAALVGRSPELELLRGALQHAVHTQRALVTTIVGPPGIGKTRLISELHTVEATTTTWLLGRALSYGDGVPLYALGEVVRAAARIVETDAPATAAAKLDRTVHAVLDEEAGWVASQLRPLVGLESERTGSRAEAFAAWRRFFESLALREPLILVLEDIHWADDGLLDFVEHLGEWARAPLLVLCSARPEIGERRELKEPIELAPLSDEDAGQLLDDLLGDVELQPDVRAAVVQHADGNPLFVEEFARTLESDGGVAHDASLPATMQGVIAARLDALPPGEKAALHDAAVLGASFSVDGLTAVARSAREDVLNRLGALEKRQFLLGALQPDEYTFGHVLVRDVAYEQLPRRDRAERHLRAAEWLETLGGRADERADLLGHHYRSVFDLRRAAGAETATIVERVVESAWRAGERARGLYANGDAETYFRQALELVPTASLRPALVAALHESLGDVLELQGKHPEGEAAYSAALEVVAGAENVARLHRKSAGSLHVQRRIEEAHAALDRAEAALDAVVPADTRGSHEERVAVGLSRLWLHYFFGTIDALVNGVDASRDLIERHGTAPQRADLFKMLSLIGIRRGRFVADDETVEYSRASLAAAEESEDRVAVAYGHFELGFCILWAGRPVEAQPELQLGLTLFESVGDLTLQTRCLTYLALSARMRGAVDETRALATRTLAAAEAGDMIEYVAQAKANLAWVAWRSGELLAAERDSAEAWELWQKIPYAGFPTIQWIATWPLIAVLLAREQTADAVAHVRALLDPERQPVPEPLRTLLASGVEAWDGGNADAARTKLGSAAVLAADHGYL
jgi:DNA-binding SARP family transcriptional activator/tetratricopeptide (TPR) repeat protein